MGRIGRPTMDVLYQLSYLGELENHNTLMAGFQTADHCSHVDKGLHLEYDVGVPNPKKPRPKCPVCSKEPYRSYYKYCSNACQQKYQAMQYINDWKSGKISGLQSLGIVTKQIKRYLREKFSDKCCLCGWSQVNPKTGKVPLVADHIDGNWRNNSEENLRLICPNCDALQPTFSALNRGNGRPNRVLSKRITEARKFLK